MSEAFDYVKQFEKLIKDKSIIEADIRAKQDEKAGLEKQIVDLRDNRDALLSEFKSRQEKISEEIKLSQENTGRILGIESDRINKKEREVQNLLEIAEKAEEELHAVKLALDAQKENQEKKEIALQRGEKEIVESRKSLGRLKDDLDLKGISTQSEISRLEGIKKEINNKLKDLDDAEEGFKNSRKTLDEQRGQLCGLRTQLEAKAWENTSLKDTLDDREKHLATRDALIEALEKRSAEREKDLKDKENSLNAFKIDLDFREAKLRVRENK